MRTLAPVNRPALSLRAVPQHRRLSTPTLRHSRTSKAESTAGTVPLCTFVYAQPLLLRPMPARAVRLQYSPAWIGEPKDPL
jgi:hypothetical protein